METPLSTHPSGPDQTIASLLEQDVTLAALVKKSKLLAHVNQVVQQALETELRNHCSVGNWNDGILTILVDSPSWATRLRFAIPKLIQILTPILTGLQTIRHRIAPTNPPKAAIYWKNLSLSENTITIVEQIAANISDRKLKAALYRLCGKI